MANRSNTVKVGLVIVIFYFLFFGVQSNEVLAQTQDELQPGKIAEASLDQNFSGVWKAMVISTTSDKCVICAQVLPDCAPNQMLVPQTCTKCAHCVDIPSNSSGGRYASTETVKETRHRKFLTNITKRFKASNVITLKLCIKDGKLKGNANQFMVINNAQVVSQSIISGNKAFVVLQDEQKKVTRLVLELINKEKLMLTFPDGGTYEAKKVNPWKECLGV